MLRGIIHSSSKICSARTATSFYRITSLRSFAAGAIENKNSNKEAEKKRDHANFHVYSVKNDAEQCVHDHEMMIRSIGIRMTRLETAMETKDAEEILAAVQDLRENLYFKESSFENNTFPTVLTTALLHRFGGKPSLQPSF